MTKVIHHATQTPLQSCGRAVAHSQRGNNRQATFFAEEDYRFYLDHLADAARKYDCAVYAYALMTNHVHLLASAEKPYDLSRMMQHLGRHFVRYINRTFRRSGTLWEGRFKANLVQTEEYFLRCCRYIECNPVRAAWSVGRVSIRGRVTGTTHSGSQAD